jgi:hypothetical protein
VPRRPSTISSRSSAVANLGSSFVTAFVAPGFSPASSPCWCQCRVEL